MTQVQILTDDGAVFAPVANVICLGRTYRAHAIELNNPVPKAPLVFLKSTRTIRPLAEGPLAFDDETFHHEAEVTALIGRELARGSTPGWSAVTAVGLGIDLTRRAHQSELKERGHPWTTAKSFEGAALVSPMVEVGALPNPDAIRFTLRVDGQLRQDGTTANLDRPIPALLAHLLTFMPLGPGDLVFTGTPAGVGPIQRGDRFELASPAIGTFVGVL